jgi:hypothetical protein
LLLLLALDAHNQDAAPGYPALAKWSGVWPSYVRKALKQLCEPTADRPALLQRLDRHGNPINKKQIGHDRVRYRLRREVDLPTESAGTEWDQADADVPTESAGYLPTDLPTDLPTNVPTEVPTDSAGNLPTDLPTESAPPFPSINPSPSPNPAAHASEQPSPNGAANPIGVGENDDEWNRDRKSWLAEVAAEVADLRQQAKLTSWKDAAIVRQLDNLLRAGHDRKDIRAAAKEAATDPVCKAPPSIGYVFERQHGLLCSECGFDRQQCKVRQGASAHAAHDFAPGHALSSLIAAESSAKGPA